MLRQIVLFFLIVIALFEMSLESSIWAYASFFLFMLFLKDLFDREQRIILPLVPTVFTKVLLSFSLIYISEGFFMPELGMFGPTQVYSAYFALISILFVSISAAVAGRIEIARPLPQQFTPEGSGLALLASVGVFGVVSLAVLYLAAAGLANGFPLLTGADRFLYRLDNPDRLMIIAITLKPALCAALGLVRFRLAPGGFVGRLAALLFWSYVGVSILYGEKFLSLIVLFIFYYIPMLATKGPRFVFSPRLIAGASILLGFALSLVYYIYSDYGILSYELTMEKMFGRFASQGQLWAISMVDSPPILNFEGHQMAAYWRVMLADNAATEAFEGFVGVFYLISRFAPQNVLNNIIQALGAVQFTGAMEAYFAVTLGHIGMLLIVALCALYAGFSAYWLSSALAFGSPVSVFFSVFNLITLSSAVNQGSLWQIFGVKALIYTAAFLAVDKIHRIILQQQRMPK